MVDRGDTLQSPLMTEGPDQPADADTLLPLFLNSPQSMQSRQFGDARRSGCGDDDLLHAVAGQSEPHPLTVRKAVTRLQPPRSRRLAPYASSNGILN